MSKLSDRIRRAAKVTPARLGFGPATVQAKRPTMLLVVKLGASESGKAADAVSAGADAIIAAGDPSKVKAEGAILGLAPDKADAKAAEAARTAGVDFLVLDPAKALAEAMLDQKLGYVLALDEPMDDVRTRLLGDLNLDAILVKSPSTPVTLASLIELRRLGALTRTPMLVQVDAGIDQMLLQVLRDSGTAGVVIEASAIGKLGELKERIAALPTPGHKKEDRAEVTVSANAAAGHDHDDGYDDDDD
ncbi:MAG: hypothetical protein ABI559_05845 [Chloroflexota bacterium]